MSLKRALAVEEGRTLFPNKVSAPDSSVLKPGFWNKKLGGEVTKGALMGYRIFSLSLEERATCPMTCLHWSSCYGNNMPFAKRYEHGPALERAIDRNLDQLPPMVLIRLHVLGDFYSEDYVRFWIAQKAKRPHMRVYGYTARSRRSPMGQLIAEHFPWIRFSGVDTGTLPHDSAARGRTPDGIVCPVQTDNSDNCGTCTLCWAVKDRILFKEH